MVQLSTIIGTFALVLSGVQAAPDLSLRQSLPDPSGEKNVGNGAGVQFIGGECLGAADCASGCCATLPRGGQTIGVCSGVGAQTQAGKQGCGFESGGSGNQGGNNNNNNNNQGGNDDNTGGGAGDNQTGGTVQPSTLEPDPAGAGNVGNGQGGQFITGECTSDADCASGCCALVNTGAQRFGICSGPGVNTQNGKQGCIAPTSFYARSAFNLLVIMLLTLSLLGAAAARDAPRNVIEFYDAVRAKGQCSLALATGFYSRDRGPNTFSYCGDALSTSGVLYFQGRNGALVNMDIDCDGVTAPNNNTSGSGANDGRCSRVLSPDLQSTTAFRDAVAAYGKPGVTDLNPYVHPYVVFGNSRRSQHRHGWRAFDPIRYGMRPLSVMAVLCPDRRTLVYGVWGDMNGDDGEKPMVGEASLALATACGGKKVDGNRGVDEHAVLYLGFTGDEAVPGPDGADWAARDFDAFERSIQGLGDRLVQRVQRDGIASGAPRLRPGLFWLAVALVTVLISLP
ncbi:glycoside hydrolase family 75 protein [Parathielavia hyrcaniae]|uniref:Endo-chitosanase n=1 Tax=Parathielavia hyrcaniae TaxID=113614 RepID=A0AAN6PS72_9PEZI|nr:glycoside hydrolase family 75 protein [Parathielavia hyrcaniae]